MKYNLFSHLFLFVALFSACKQKENGTYYPHWNDVIFEGFDTMSTVRKYIPSDTVSNKLLMKNDTTPGLESPLVVASVIYGPLPAENFWVKAEDYYDVYWPDNMGNPVYLDSGSHNPSIKSSQEFDFNGYYLEPASPELKLTWRLHYFFNEIKLYGRFYKTPRDSKVIGNQDFPAGKILRYYKYEIVKPYRIIGPSLFNGVTKKGDTLYKENILTVQ